jgi:short-subunit dehydrogenase
LDVTEPASIEAAIGHAIVDFGAIDVLVNNAGYAVIGPFETASETQVRRQFDTNVIGLMNVIRAMLPHFRQRRAGTIVNISSIGGQITLPLYSLYHGTKWAVEGFSESLQYELRTVGIKVRLIEPGTIKTDFYGRSMDQTAKAIPDYDALSTRLLPALDRFTQGAPGPEIVARRIWQAATHRGGKLRWLVGREGPIVMLRRWIPNRLFFALVRGMLGVN